MFRKNLLFRGFTLIEILVVIAIIGLLASVVLSSLNSARLKGQTAAAQQTMKSMQAAAIVCMGDSAEIAVPTETVDGGTGLLCAGNTATYVALPAGWIYCDADDTGVQAGPPTPDCGNEAFIQVTGTSFRIVAENGASGDIVTCTENSCERTTEAVPD